MEADADFIFAILAQILDVAPIDAESARVTDLIHAGGYLPHTDHSCPPDISFQLTMRRPVCGARRAMKMSLRGASFAVARHEAKQSRPMLGIASAQTTGLAMTPHRLFSG